MINRVAARYLPSDVPAFLRTGTGPDTLAYLGPEPDRWHNKAERELRDQETPDHFIDLEYASMLPGPLPRERRDYVTAIEKLAAEHPDLRLTAGKVGFQPYAVEEAWEKLKVDMREYRKLHDSHASEEQAARLVILYDAGILGHYVADGSQPLHTTLQFNGWTGPNPEGYNTAHTVHSAFESTWVKTHFHPEDFSSLVASTRSRVIDDVFTQYNEYLRRTATFVEPLYKLEKAGGFTGSGTPEARAFTRERLAAGAIELRDLIYSAWVHSAEPIQEYKGPQ